MYDTLFRRVCKFEKGHFYNVEADFDEIDLEMRKIAHPMGGGFNIYEVSKTYVLATGPNITLAKLVYSKDFKAEQAMLELSLRHIDREQKFPELEELAKKFSLEPEGTKEIEFKIAGRE